DARWGRAARSRTAVRQRLNEIPVPASKARVRVRPLAPTSRPHSARQRLSEGSASSPRATSRARSSVGIVTSIVVVATGLSRSSKVTIIRKLDGFYCANVIASLWADAVGNRLEGPAIFLLSDELGEVSEHARGAAQRLADRIADLGGAITADPRELLDVAPRD